MPVNDLEVLKVDSFHMFPLIGWLADQRPIRDWVVFQAPGHSTWLGSNLQEVAIVSAAIFGFLSAAISRTLLPADYTCYCNSKPNSCQKTLFCTVLYQLFPLVWFTSPSHLDSVCATATNLYPELFASPSQPPEMNFCVWFISLPKARLHPDCPQSKGSICSWFSIFLLATILSIYFISNLILWRCNWGWLFPGSFM